MIEMCYYAVLTWFEVPLFNGISLLYGLELGYDWWEILLTTTNPLIPCQEVTKMIHKQIEYWKSLTKVELYMVLIWTAGTAAKTLNWLLGGA